MSIQHLAWMGMVVVGTLTAMRSPAAGAAADGTACYRFASSSPAARLEEGAEDARSELWCYRDYNGPLRGKFVFNADGDSVRPELAFWLDSEGIITHGSLSAGEVSVHRVRAAEYVPYPVPIEAPRSLRALAPPPELSVSAAETLDYLLREAPARVEELSPAAAPLAASANYLPWRGYWWPTRGLPLAGPMGRYDRFVVSRGGADPGSVAWEGSHHYYRGISWEGHCNGWAAASVLRSEPPFARRDPQSGIAFSVSDQKGLLSELDYCARAAFFGTRYDGSNDIRDIDPVPFHQTLIYYIGNLHKPIVMDYDRRIPVDNHVVTGYSMNIKQTGRRTYSVTTSIAIHGYDTSIVEEPGSAPAYTRVYRYTLRTDSDGNLRSGQWKSQNPDFLWVPLGPGRCSYGNPGLTEEGVAAVLALPAG